MPFGHRHSLLGRPVPARRQSSSRPAYRPTSGGSDRNGVSTFHTHETRPDRVPPLPRDGDAHTTDSESSVAACRFSTASPAPRCCFHPSRAQRNGTSRDLLAFTPAGLPLACNPRMEQGPLGIFPELRTPPLPATHVKAGTGVRALARVTQPPSSAGPPICVSTHHVRPRVALRRRCCRRGPAGRR